MTILRDLRSKICALEKRQEFISQVVRHEFYPVSVTLDENGIVTSVDGDVEGTLGYTQEEYLGLNTFDLIYPDDYEYNKLLFDALINSKDEVAISILRFKRKDGQYVVLYVRGTNLLHTPARCVYVQFRKIATSPL